MFHYISGVAAELLPGAAVIDCGGVGFHINTSSYTLSQLKTGEKAKLYTYVYIREDAFDIYGFYDQREKRCFELLLSISGVGPKAALSILSYVTPENLALAIASENEKMLTAAPGIGKRIAQRILLELKDKVATADMPASKNETPVSVFSSDTVSEAEAGLLVLGYSRAEITAALRKINTENMSVEDIIREVLRSSLK